MGGALRALAARLAAAGLDDAPSVAEWALASVLGCRPLEVYLGARTPLAPDAAAALARMADRLVRDEPIQYVTGFTEFCGLRLATDRRALIPRPETEALVTALAEDPGLKAAAAPALADVGTGSGAIAVALALALPRARLLAVDGSADALALARENARRHGVAERIRFQCADLLGDAPAARLDAIAANLPYVATAVWAALPARVREYEPAVALDGGVDGLALIRRLAAQAIGRLRPGGLLALEIGEDQGAAVRAELEGHGFADVRVQPDPAGHDRLVLARRPGSAKVDLA